MSDSSGDFWSFLIFCRLFGNDIDDELVDKYIHYKIIMGLIGVVAAIIFCIILL